MPTDAEKLGLPPRQFMYHFDQVAAMLSVSETQFRTAYVYYEGLSSGPPSRDRLAAINIAPKGVEPEWRIPEVHLVRWMKHKRIRFYTRGFV